MSILTIHLDHDDIEEIKYALMASEATRELRAKFNRVYELFKNSEEGYFRIEESKIIINFSVNENE